MLTVYLARHGQTQENVDRIFQGHLPGVLTSEGKRQAVLLGKRLETVPLDAVLSSDLQRVIDTVELAVGGRNLPWQTTELLREADWGHWTGLPLSVAQHHTLPADAETPSQLYERAARCWDYIRHRYAGKQILVVAHGLIIRYMRACLSGIPSDRLSEVPPMNNGQVIRLTID